MADEQKIATIEKMMEYPARLQMSMLGPVKDIAASIPAGDKEVRIIGYVMGEARGVSYRNNPNSADGGASAALIGVFNGVPAYEDFPGMKPGQGSKDRPELGSGVCFLPDQAQQTIVHRVSQGERYDGETPKRGQRVDVLGVVVPIAFEIGIRKSESPVGYEWVTRGLAKVEARSPIERMRAALQLPSGADMKALAADGTLAKIVTNADKGTPALAAPQVEKPKGKTSRKR